MNSKDFPILQYLNRIGLSSPPDADEDGLREVHSAQAFSIPFENLDIHLGRSISLKPDDLIAKILNHRRGGYCFELNGIFCSALKALGFAVRPRLARVLYDRTDPGAHSHQVLLVAISGNDWLADVGFGGPGLRLPLPLGSDQIHEQYGERYRLRRDSILGWILQKENKGSLIDLYAFRDELTLDVDIEMANHYTSTWPTSIFRLRRMCALPKPRGRITLADMELTIYRDGQSDSRVLPPGPEYMEAIVEHFGLNLNAKYSDFAPLCSEGAI